MLTQYIRLLGTVTLSEGDAMASNQVLDLGNYKELEIVFRVLQAGEGDAPRLIVEHSASNEEGAWLAFADPVEVDLSATGNTWVHQGGTGGSGGGSAGYCAPAPSSRWRSWRRADGVVIRLGQEGTGHARTDRRSMVLRARSGARAAGVPVFSLPFRGQGGHRAL